MQCRGEAGTGQIACVSMCVSVFFFFFCTHARAALCSVCHSGPCAAGVCAAHCTAEWGTAWAWPAISPPTTRTDTQAGLCLCFSLQERVCARVYVCMRVCVCVCVCICRVNTNHPFPLTPSLSLFLSLALFVCVSPLSLVFRHPPRGTARTAAVPMTTSVLLSISSGCLIPPWVIFYICGLPGFDRCADGTSHICIAPINKCTSRWR